MTTLAQAATRKPLLASFAVMALIGVTAGLVHNLPESDPVWRAPVQVARNHVAPAIANTQRFQPRHEAGDQVGTLSASEVNRCIMPPAWRRGCEVSTVKIAAR
jgi:hypothetical protein